MSDFEDGDFCVESWTLPPKVKRKKDSIKDKKEKKCKKNRPIKTQKKTSKSRETVMERKHEKKEKKEKKKKKDQSKTKKKKRKKLALELDDSFSFTQGSSGQAQLFDKLVSINSRQNKKLNPDNLTQGSVKEAKKRKIMANLLPTSIRVKRPNFTSSSPKDSEDVDVREGDSCSQVTLPGQIQNQPHDDLQCTDDINSQDLFITQKTFKASPSGTSSSETSDEVVTVSPQVFTQRDKNQRTSVEDTKQSQEKSNTRPQDSRQMCRMSREQEPKTEDRAEEDRGIHEPQRWKEFKESVSVKSKVVNPPQDEPFIINPTQDVSRLPTSSLQHHKSFLFPPRTATSSTQTDNFFTTELSSYSSFCQRSRKALHFEDLQPLDLSLPERARKGLRVSAKMSVIGIKQKPNELLLQGGMNCGEGVFASPRVEHVESKKVLPCLDGTTPSPQSEAGTKSADTTASSEDDHTGHSGKRDMMQVGAVQLRLNKPFFFKTKGEGQSPRPESPLMKLSQGRDPKSKKRR